MWAIRLTSRVFCVQVREELKRYLDDDSDMRDMYLTRRLLAELFGGRMGVDGQTPGGIGINRNHDSPRFSMTARMRRASVNLESKLEAMEKQKSTSPKKADFELGGVGFDEGSNPYYEEEEEWVDPKDEDRDLQEVEDLLETYFTHIDSTFAELQALDENIDDTVRLPFCFRACGQLD